MVFLNLLIFSNVTWEGVKTGVIAQWKVYSRLGEGLARRYSDPSPESPSLAHRGWWYALRMWLDTSQPGGSFFSTSNPTELPGAWAEEEPSGKEHGHHPGDALQATDQPIRSCSCNSPVASHTPQTWQALHLPGHWWRITGHSTSSPACNTVPSWIVSQLTLHSSPWPVPGDDVFWKSDDF